MVVFTARRRTAGIADGPSSAQVAASARAFSDTERGPARGDLSRKTMKSLFPQKSMISQTFPEAMGAGTTASATQCRYLPIDFARGYGLSGAPLRPGMRARARPPRTGPPGPEDRDGIDRACLWNRGTAFP